MIDLQKYCMDSGDPRYYLTQPFSKDKSIYATNGHLAIRIDLNSSDMLGLRPKIDEEFLDQRTKDLHNSTAVKIDEYLQGVEDLQFVNFDALPPVDFKCCSACDGKGVVPKKIVCSECDGYGEVTLQNSHNTYEVECKTCDGKHEVNSPSELEPCSNCEGQGKVVDERLNRVRLSGPMHEFTFFNHKLRLMAELPGAMYSVYQHGLAVKFDGGYGLLMRLKEENEVALGHKPSQQLRAG